jgi:hypothetical protein
MPLLDGSRSATFSLMLPMTGRSQLRTNIRAQSDVRQD